MRKRTVNFCFDKILWGLIMLLPLLLYCIYLISIKDSAVSSYTFEQYLGENGFFFTNGFDMQFLVTHNVVANMFYEVFESGAYGMQITGGYFLSWYLMYLIIVEFMHICVDVILILPRVCNKLFDNLKHED